MGTILPPPPSTMPAPPLSPEEREDEVWSSVLEEARATWRPSGEPGDARE